MGPLPSLSLSSLTCSPPYSPTIVSASPSSSSASPETSSTLAFAGVDPSLPISSAPCWCPHILEICLKCLSWGRCLWLLEELTSYGSCVSGATSLSPIMTQVSIIQLSVYPLAQRSLIFLVPGTSFIEDNFSMDWGWGVDGFRTTQAQ